MTKQTLIELRAQQEEYARRMAPTWRSAFMAIRRMNELFAARIHEILTSNPEKTSKPHD